MKLLVDCTPLHAGGGVQVAIAFFEGLANRTDIDWVAVVPEGMRKSLSKTVKSKAIKIEYRQKNIRLNILLTTLALKRIERNFRPDVVFTVFGPAYFRARAPHVVGFALPNLIYEPTDILIRAGGALSGVADAVRCHLLRQADHIVVETETVRARLARRLDFDRERVSVIGNSVNPLLLKHAVSPKPAQKRFVVIIPSAYYLHKNLEILPHVAAALKRLDGNLDFEFRLTLPSSSRPWLAITEHATQLGVRDQMKTLEPLSLDALASAYGQASAVLLPTLREASTAVYPESFHFLRPLITSDMDFARELCGDAALYAPPLNPGAFASHLRELSRNPTLVRRQVTNGQQQLARQYPTAEQKLEEQIKLLQQACLRYRRAPRRRPSDPVASQTGE